MGAGGGGCAPFSGIRSGKSAQNTAKASVASSAATTANRVARCRRYRGPYFVLKRKTRDETVDSGRPRSSAIWPYVFRSR